MTVTRRLAAAFASAITLLALGAFAVLPVAAADTTAPAIAKAVMRDVDADGKADGVVVYYREAVYHLSDTDRVYPFKVSGYTVRSVGAATGGRYVIVNLVEKTTSDLSARPTVSYTRTTLAGKPVRDAARNQAPTQSFPWTIPVRAVFVSPTGNDANAGTQAAPKKTINAGIARSLTIGARDIYVATGTYNEGSGLNLATNRNIWGRYIAGSWYRATSGSTIVEGKPQGALADHDTGVWLRDIVIKGAASVTVPSAYGIRALNGSSISLERVNVIAGAGAAGGPGGPGAMGAPGAAGASGTNGCEGTSCGFGGAGGVGPNAGGRGGDGGYDSNGGQNGLPGTGPGPGPVGVGGAGSGCFGGGNDGGAGGAGANGSPGANGAAAAGSPNTEGALWVGRSGQAGTAGAPGTGGSGGGGGGGGDNASGFCNSDKGGGGGGGGATGAGGQGGGGGAAGGGSFGIYLHDSTVTTRAGVLITASAGGTGGTGGAVGTGGTGGNGGGGGAGNDDAGAGGAGGRGGNGGNGGGGGGGAGGWSVGIFKAGTLSGANLTVAPLITVGPAGAGGTGASGQAAAGQAPGIYP